MGRKKGRSVGRKKSQPKGFISQMLKWLQSDLAQWCKRRAGLFLILLVAGSGVVFLFSRMEGYVQNVTEKREVALAVKLNNPPKWLSEQLISEICLSSGINRNDFLLDENLTHQWAENLSQNPWVKAVRRIHKQYDGLVVLDCEIRRPLAKIVRQGKTCYVDFEGVVLPYSPTYGHLVTLHGSNARLPQPGQSITMAPLIAGLEVLQLILQIDEQLPAQDRLWQELAYIDVSNFEGRRDSARPHLALYTRGNTEIRWGAPVGNYLPYYEAPDKLKLTTLYREFKQTGSLDQYQYVELRNHRKEKADPLKQPIQNS